MVFESLPQLTCSRPRPRHPTRLPSRRMRRRRRPHPTWPRLRLRFRRADVSASRPLPIRPITCSAGNYSPLPTKSAAVSSRAWSWRRRDPSSCGGRSSRRWACSWWPRWCTPRPPTARRSAPSCLRRKYCPCARLRIGRKLLRFCGNGYWRGLWIVELVCPLIISKQQRATEPLLQSYYLTFSGGRQ